jgi:hypothetical protein
MLQGNKEMKTMREKQRKQVKREEESKIEKK